MYKISGVESLLKKYKLNMLLYMVSLFAGFGIGKIDDYFFNGVLSPFISVFLIGVVVGAGIYIYVDYKFFKI